MDGYRLERERVRAGFARAAAHYDEHAVVQARVRGQLLERLDYVRIEPSLVVDIGAGTGRAVRPLSERYPGARILALDSSAAMLHKGQGRGVCVIADAREVPLADGTADLIFSNFLLPWCDDPAAVFAEFRRVIAPRGLLSFTTLGPDTLVELRTAWYEADRRQHLHGFFDMHDIGDALVRAGFVEPVMDVERYTLTYPDVSALLEDLRRSGSANALPQRPRGLMGRGVLERLTRGYQQVEGRLPVTVEVVFGQAWCPAGRADAPAADRLARIDPRSIGRRQR